MTMEPRLECESMNPETLVSIFAGVVFLVILFLSGVKVDE
jgi:hypothetical protein